MRHRRSAPLTMKPAIIRGNQLARELMRSPPPSATITSPAGYRHRRNRIRLSPRAPRHRQPDTAAQIHDRALGKPVLRVISNLRRSTRHKQRVSRKTFNSSPVPPSLILSQSCPTIPFRHLLATSWLNDHHSMHYQLQMVFRRSIVHLVIFINRHLASRLLRPLPEMLPSLSCGFRRVGATQADLLVFCLAACAVSGHFAH